MKKIHFDPKRLISFKNDFDRIIELEIMQSEKLRAAFLAGVFLTLSVFSFILRTAFYADVEKIFNGRLNLLLIGAVLIILSLYEFGFRTAIMFFQKKEMKFPVPPRFANALVETSIPSALILLIIPVFGAEQALTMPPVFAYFLFIGLSALRVDFRLSLFTGLIAAVEYFLIFLLYLNPLQNPHLFPIYLAKTVLLFIAGCISAFVTYQIRQRLINLFRYREERNFISGVFGQHVSPAVMEKLLEQKSDVITENRYVCVMFLDIRNFTAFSQNRNPEEVVEFLNTLFDFMIETVNKNHGIINKFLGDGFMAVFGAPISSGKDSENAVRASLEMIEELEKLVQDKKIIPTKIGIGLHSGKAVTGNIGSSRRKEYTIIGDVVNLASRIESQNKTFHSSLLVSADVWKAVQDVFKEIQKSPEFKALGPVEVKGHEAVELFRLK